MVIMHPCTYIPFTNVMWRKIIYVFVPLGVARSVKFVNSCGNISTRLAKNTIFFFLQVESLGPMCV